MALSAIPQKNMAPMGRPNRGYDNNLAIQIVLFRTGCVEAFILRLASACVKK